MKAGANNPPPTGSPRPSGDGPACRRRPGRTCAASACPARCTARPCWTRRTRCCAPASCGTTPAAIEEAAELDGDPMFRRITGNIVFPGFTAPKLIWVQRHEPAIWDRVAKVLLPKDYLRLWLTGEHVAEMSDAAGTSWLDTGARDWSDDLLTATGLSRAPDAPPGRRLRRLRHAARRAGRPLGPARRGGRSRAAAATTRPRASAWAWCARARPLSRSAPRACCFAANDGYQPDPGNRRPHLLPCPAEHLAPDGRDPGRHRFAELVCGLVGETRGQADGRASGRCRPPARPCSCPIWAASARR